MGPTRGVRTRQESKSSSTAGHYTRTPTTRTTTPGQGHNNKHRENKTVGKENTTGRSRKVLKEDGHSATR